MEGIIPIESKQENLATTATLDSTELPLVHKLMKTEHESPTIHIGKRKRLDEQLIKVQNIVNKMMTVDKIVNEFYTLGNYKLVLPHLLSEHVKLTTTCIFIVFICKSQISR